MEHAAETGEKACCAAKPPRAEALKQKLVLYRPLAVILGVSALAALAMEGVPFMRGLMGMFLVFLATLKFFDLKGFADGFMRYDVLAKKFRPYALAYPFIELALGGLYLSGAVPVLTGLVTVFVMALGTAGVARVIRSDMKVQCACAGTGFNLPVGYVTLFENLAMGAMGLMTALS